MKNCGAQLHQMVLKTKKIVDFLFQGHSLEIEMEHGDKDHREDIQEVSARVVEALGDKPTRPMHRP